MEKFVKENEVDALSDSQKESLVWMLAEVGKNLRKGGQINLGDLDYLSGRYDELSVLDPSELKNIVKVFNKSFIHAGKPELEGTKEIIADVLNLRVEDELE